MSYYNQWSQSSPPTAAHSIPNNDGYPPYQAGSAAPVNHNHGHYSPQIDTPMPALMDLGQPRHNPVMYGNQFQPSERNRRPFDDPTYPPALMRSPDPIITQSMKSELWAGPFEAMPRRLEVAPNDGWNQGLMNSPDRGGGWEKPCGPRPLLDVVPEHRGGGWENPRGPRPLLDVVPEHRGGGWESPRGPRPLLDVVPEHRGGGWEKPRGPRPLLDVVPEHRDFNSSFEVAANDGWNQGLMNSPERGGGWEKPCRPIPLLDVVPEYKARDFNSSFEMYESDEWNDPSERWDNSNSGLYRHPDNRMGGPFNSWKVRSVTASKWSFSNKKKHGKERGVSSARDLIQFNQNRFGGALEKPLPLMGFDFEVNRDNRLTKKRQLDNQKEEHFNPMQAKKQAKRHVDEDLKVTIRPSKGAPAEGEEGKKYLCTVCKLIIQKNSEYLQHLRGKRHKEKVAETNEKKKKTNQLNQNKKQPNQLVKRDIKDVLDDPNIAIATDQDIALDDTLTLIPLNDPEKLKFYCIICRLSLVSETNVKAHECTPNHIKRKKEVDDLGKNKDEGSSVCLHCVSVYKNAEEEEHKMSETHKKMLHWRMASCEICARRFNIPAALEKHFNASPHRRQYKKFKENGLSVESMIKYYEVMQVVVTEKKESFCHMCNTSCGHNENLELHNAVAARYHEEVKRERAKAGPSQYYCFGCKEFVNKPDRQVHDRDKKHKALRKQGLSFDCEDCCVTFAESKKLKLHFAFKTHLTQVERRKAIQSYTINKFIRGWKAKQAEANAAVRAELTKRVKKEAPDGVVRQEPSSDSTKQVDLSVNSDLSVIPVSGHFCTICNTFYQFDAERENICSHVRKAKGIRDEPKEPVVSKGDGNNDGAKATEAEANDETNTMERDKMDVEHSMEEPVESSQAAADAEEQLEANGDCGDEKEVDMENDEAEKALESE